MTIDDTRVTPNSRTGVVAKRGTGTPRLGERVCKCAACGEYFTSTANFDRHRSWATDDGTPVVRRGYEHDAQRRVCFYPADIGLVQRENGVWGGPPMTEQQKRERGWA